MKSYRELQVWQKGIDVVMATYHLTKQFPKEELFGLTSQMRRAAVSIPANVAEGFARKHRSEYAHFVRIAFASGAELETHVEIAKKLRLAPPSAFTNTDSLLTETMKMLNGLSSALVASR